MMLVPMTLTLMQGHSGSAEKNGIWAMAFKLRMTIDCGTYAHGVCFFDALDLALDFENVCKARPLMFSETVHARSFERCV